MNPILVVPSKKRRTLSSPRIILVRYFPKFLFGNNIQIGDGLVVG